MSLSTYPVLGTEPNRLVVVCSGICLPGYDGLTQTEVPPLVVIGGLAAAIIAVVSPEHRHLNYYNLNVLLGTNVWSFQFRITPA